MYHHRLGHRAALPNLLRYTLKDTDMNYSTAVFLINKDTARAINVTYEEDSPSGAKQQRYTFKTLDQSIVAGDLVVIPTDTRHKMTVVKVDAVDVDVDFDSAVQLKWIIDKVDCTEHERVLKMEGDAIAKIKSAEIRRKREELADKLMKDNPDLQGLEISAMTAPALPAE